MALGRVDLADGTAATGFLCEPYAVHGATDITEHGGWRAYRAAASAAGGSHRPRHHPTEL